MFIISGDLRIECVKEVIQAVHEEDISDRFENIEITLTTAGGDIDAPIAIGNYIKTQTKKPLKIVCSGTVQSAGITLIAFADQRVAYEDCIFMVHGASLSYDNIQLDKKDFESKVKLLKMVEKRDYNIYEKTWGKEIADKLQELSKSGYYDSFLTAEEAKEFGIIDEIIYYPKD